MSTAIKVENLSKAYQLGQIGTGTISRDIERWWALKRGKEDPFLKIGETNDRTLKGGSDIVWSLKDLDFEIKQGDAVGIIGRNGAGKSTLLKILSRVTSPTTGNIRLKGRVASLLEVGTGFHPELSGKENIFLNGAILGMRKREIQRKLDEIIDFAGVERYIDTPVKRYSSGMYVRLAFAVAAHLESEILIVDEVLAVGDFDFQQKCLGKMNDVSKGQGRTVLFVSHNMAAVKNLCKTGILLKNGVTQTIGKIDEVVHEYNRNLQFEFKSKFSNPNQSKKDVSIAFFNFTSKLETGRPLRFEVMVHSNVKKTIHFAVGFRLPDATAVMQVFSGHVVEEFELRDGANLLSGEIDSLPLSTGTYMINLWLGSGGIELDFHPNALTVNVDAGSIRSGGPVSSKNGYPVIMDAKWRM